MKIGQRILLFEFLLLFALGSSALAQSVTVVAPNGGETWPVAEVRNITWSTTGAVGSLKIDYSVDGGIGWLPVTAGTANTGLYAWTVPNNISTNCKVRVAVATNTAIYDVSDGVFSIYEARSVTVVTPNGGETWPVAEVRNITWTTTGVVGSLKIDYSVDGGIGWLPVTAGTANTGLYAWTVPNNISTNCKVRVAVATNTAIYDMSDGGFSIYEARSVTVVTPNGGETWRVGEVRNIAWTTTGVVGSLKIDYSVDGGIGLLPVTAGTANTGLYAWTVPNNISTNCKVRVAVATNTAINDVSDGVFTILPIGDVVVISPNGGESWQRGTTHAITWTPVNLMGDVTIELWKSGALNRNLATVPVTPASYSWTIDPAQAEGSDYRVRIYQGSVTDESDNNFTITLEPSGSLQVTLLPLEAVSDGAKWRVDGNSWIDSGAVVNDLSEGDHSVEYQQVTGWTAPGQEQVLIESGQTKQISRSYVRLEVLKHAAGDFDGDKSEEAILDFGTSGAWMYDSGAWSQITIHDPEGMIPFDIDGNGDDELAVDLGSLGLWMWNGGIWSQLTVNSPEYMIAVDSNGNGIDELVLDYGSVGLWSRQENSSWFGLTAYDPENIIAVDVDNNGTDEVVAEFGPLGMWIWEGLGMTWNIMSSADPNTMVDMDPYGYGSNGVVAGFGSLGTWLWDGGLWGQLSAISPDNLRSGALIPGGGEEIAADYSTLGLWVWGASVWAQMSGVNPDEIVVADVDGNGIDEIIGDFGPPGLWISSGGSWTQLSGIDPEGILAADIDEDAAKEVIGDFGALGVWLWDNTAWTRISDKNPD